MKALIRGNNDDLEPFYPHIILKKKKKSVITCLKGGLISNDEFSEFKVLALHCTQKLKIFSFSFFLVPFYSNIYIFECEKKSHIIMGKILNELKMN